MKSKARLRALEARVAALEAARPTVEFAVPDWSKIPDAEPIDVQLLARSVFGEYSYGSSDDEDWSASGYI